MYQIAASCGNGLMVVSGARAYLNICNIYFANSEAPMVDDFVPQNNAANAGNGANINSANAGNAANTNGK